MSFIKLEDIQSAYIELYASNEISIRDCIEKANDDFFKMNFNQDKLNKKCF